MQQTTLNKSYCPTLAKISKLKLFFKFAVFRAMLTINSYFSFILFKYLITVSLVSIYYLSHRKNTSSPLICQSIYFHYINCNIYQQKPLWKQFSNLVLHRLLLLQITLNTCIVQPVNQFLRTHFLN